jgi:hypothetical protein
MLLDLLGLIGARAWIPKVSDQPRNPHEFRPSFPLPSFIPLVLLYGALTQRAIALVLRYATIHYTVMYTSSVDAALKVLNWAVRRTYRSGGSPPNWKAMPSGPIVALR